MAGLLGHNREGSDEEIYWDESDDEPWKTDEQVKWENVRDKAFKVTLEQFMDFLKTQDQLKTAADLVHGLTYTNISSWNRLDTSRCILWDGILVKPEDDAQLNIEIDVFAQRGVGECRIYAHTKGLPLTEGWHKASEPNAADMIRELGKTGLKIGLITKHIVTER